MYKCIYGGIHFDFLWLLLTRNVMVQETSNDWDVDVAKDLCLCGDVVVFFIRSARVFFYFV